MPMDGTIHILSVPMVGETPFLNLRPPEINIALVDQEYTKFSIDTVNIPNNVRKFISRDAFQCSKVNNHACSSNAWIRLAFAVR